MRTSHRQAFILALSLTACVLALTAPRRASAYSYISNGGFEHGDEAWSISNQVQFDTVDSSAVVPREGAYSGKITLSGSGVLALRQTSSLNAPGSP